MDKRTIAHRLALGAAGAVYAGLAKEGLVWAGPRFKSIVPLGNHTPNGRNESGRWLLTFDISNPSSLPSVGTGGGAAVPAGAALRVLDQGQGVSGFEIANGCYWGCMWVPAPVVALRPPDQLVTIAVEDGVLVGTLGGTAMNLTARAWPGGELLSGQPLGAAPPVG